MRCLLLSLMLLFAAGCVAPVLPALDAPSTRPARARDGGDPVDAWRIDRRLILAERSDDGSYRVEHPAHADLLRSAGAQVRLLPDESADSRRFAILAASHVILRRAPQDAPGTRDNLSELTQGEELWLLDRDPTGADGKPAWLVHSSDGYIGWVDEADLTFIDADAFAQRLRSHTSEPAQAKIEQVIETAKAKMGTPYLWGGRTAAGIDCSGLTQTSYAAVGVRLPRDSDMQANVGRLVALRDQREGLVPGDLLFFLHERRGRIYHTAIYLGDGLFIEAGGEDVHLTSLNPDDPHYNARRDRDFAWARRVIE